MCNTFSDQENYLYGGTWAIVIWFIKLHTMKNSLFVIAGLLLVIWGILFWGLHTVGPVHFLLAGAAFIILVRLVFSKKLGHK